MNQNTISSAELKEFTSFTQLAGQAYRALTGDITSGMQKSEEATKAAKKSLEALESSFSGNFKKAFLDIAKGGKDLESIFQNLALSISNDFLNSTLQPITKTLGKDLAGIASKGLPNIFSSIFQSSKGDALNGGNIRAFANGGVVGGPTTFPMRGGTGLMGEAGPEAIMPLSRGADGKLGVRAGNGSSAPTVNITINTPDVQNFARSRTQIANSLSRAVQRGSRNQ